VCVSHGSTFESLVFHTSNRKLPLNHCHLPLTLNTCSTIHQRFSDQLTQALCSKRPVTPTGDFCVLVDDLSDQMLVFLDILSVFGLSQHIKNYTHCGCRTLDLLITHAIVTGAVSVSPLHLSDHCLVSFSLPTTPQLKYHN